MRVLTDPVQSGDEWSYTVLPVKEEFYWLRFKLWGRKINLGVKKQMEAACSFGKRDYDKLTLLKLEEFLMELSREKGE